MGGVNTPQLLFYIQNIKDCPTSGYGFLKFFATYEQWVLIYRTYCSLGCKNNIVILIENENLLSPHLLYTKQSHKLHFPLLTHSLHPSHSSPSLSQLQKRYCPYLIILFFDEFFFSSSLYCSIPKLKNQGLLVLGPKKKRVVGLILGFFWNFWVSRWSMLPPRFWICSFSVAGLVMEQVGVFFSSSLYCSIPKLKIEGLLV